MKITCQSCQSKYNVADEKVHGKIVKIRCRKCGGTIVVNATAGGSNGARAIEDPGVSLAPAQPSMVAAPSTTGEWHVNLGDNDQRTLSLADLVAAYNEGTVTQDTFIWTDGMDDWRPLAEVEAVVGALHAAAQAPAPAPSSPRAAFEAPAAAPAAYEAPYQAPAAPYEAPAAAAAAYAGPAFAAQASPVIETKRAAVKREPRGRDLFSTHAGEELQTSAAAAAAMGAPQVDGGGMTGQRNENSVLFSLAVLTKSGEDRAAPDAPAASSKDDSGMIDLKALVARADSARPAARIEGDVFAPPLGIPAAPLGSPLGPLGAQGAEAQGKSKLPLFIGAGLGMAVLLAVGVFIGVKVAPGGSVAAPLPSAAASIAPIASPSATAEPSASAAPPEASASPSASVAASAQKPKAAAAGGGTWHPPASTKAPSGAQGAAPTPAAGLPASPAPKKSGGGDCGCNGDLMCLMKCSTH